jgi:hypothetical protein
VLVTERVVVCIGVAERVVAVVACDTFIVLVGCDAVAVGDVVVALPVTAPATCTTLLIVFCTRCTSYNALSMLVKALPTELQPDSMAAIDKAEKNLIIITMFSFC